MTVHSLVYILLIGLIAGWLAGKLTKEGGHGLLGDLVIGVIGAFIGGYIFELLRVPTAGLVDSLISATCGAVLLVLGLRLVRGHGRHRFWRL